ncbi:MAG: hypothetical protein C0609_05620 [Deltaproteobacteria bacterium]|nr:MAG: hypothetical protein C0609_05620 [Deltaproteobacteria bacterium]
MIIPFKELSDEALTGLIEEYVTREGTDYGGVRHDLAEKVSKVRDQLERGEVLVVFDPGEGTANLLTAAMVKDLMRPPSGGRLG